MAINTDPINGETPIANAPTYSGPGGGTGAMQVYAFQEFQKLFGRNPTQSELDELAPSYALDANRTNSAAGNAAVAAYYNSYANTPTNITAQQNAQALKAYQTGQSGFDATTNSAFQQAVGRNATSDELAHFGSLLATGATDAYGLNQLIGTTQEAQQKQTQNYQTQLSQNLQQTQGDYYKNYINPSILSQTAATGRDPNSSGVQQAEVQAGQQQNYQLQDYLANFGASQYGQSAQNQQGVYQQYLNQQYNLQNSGISQQLGQQANLQSYNQNLANYQLQQNSYQNYLNNYGKSNPLGGALTGALSGAGAGAKIGGPWGALIGAGVGGAGGYASAGGKL